MEVIIQHINNNIWSWPLILLCLGAGFFFSILTRFCQVRHFGEMWRLLFKDHGSQEGISSFQALAVSLSGRVGMGNIAGVAAAIGFGGPGAIFWMWMVAFLGASTAYVESTLAQMYKIVDPETGQYRGGPAHYFERCKGGKFWKIYGIVFAVSAIIACGLFLPGVQANGVANAVTEVFGNGDIVQTSIAGKVGVNKLIAVAVILLVLGFIIFGGIKRIASFTQIIVPFMALGYIILALIIVFMNIDRVPGIFSMIFSDAFTAQAGFGAAIGWGVKRGIYSNEAGQGTGPHAAGAAEVEHPSQQGLVQAFSVYVDTLFVCTATALMILLTGQYNIVNNKADEFTFTLNNAPAWLKIDAKNGSISLNEQYSLAKAKDAANKNTQFSIIANQTPTAKITVIEKSVEIDAPDDSSVQSTEIKPALHIERLAKVPGKAFDILLPNNLYDTNADSTLYQPTMFIVNNVPTDTEINSPAFTQKALEKSFGHLGSTFVAIAIFFFAFTTILAYYYIAEVNVAYLSQKIGMEGPALLIVKLVIMFAVAYGAVNSSGYIWAIGDIGVGLMAWLNIIGILALFFIARPTMRALKDYEDQQKAGIKNFTFNPTKLGITNAIFWEERWKRNNRS